MERGVFRAGLAEALGVFFLVFVGGSAICMHEYQIRDLSISGDSLRVVQYMGLLGIAFAHGFALTVAVYMTAGLSGGHINPAVTIGLLAIGKVEFRRAATYVFMQLGGAVAAGIAVWAMFPGFREMMPYLGTPEYDADKMSMVKAIGVESLLTFLLMFSVLMTAVDPARRAKQMFGLCIGLTLFFCILIGGPYTGAALNPARHLGTALVSGQPQLLAQVPTYVVGPILGALAAALLYRFLLRSKEEAQSG
ncbi:MAG: aquaporin [Armatimonadetes bacterium]|nr:aquaporin [Armatimonadota bacterium]